MALEKVANIDHVIDATGAKRGVLWGSFAWPLNQRNCYIDRQLEQHPPPNQLPTSIRIVRPATHAPWLGVNDHMHIWQNQSVTPSVLKQRDGP